MNRARVATWCLGASLLAAGAPVLAQQAGQSPAATVRAQGEGVFARWDTDGSGDGSLQFDEYIRLLRRLSQAPGGTSP